MSLGTIDAVDKQLKARNTEATNNIGPYIKVSDEERVKLEAMLLSMESLLLSMESLLLSGISEETKNMQI